MSRAIHVDLPITDVAAACRRHDARFSAIEALPSGGTRVVMLSMDAAARMSRAFGKRVIEGYVDRHPLRTGTR